MSHRKDRGVPGVLTRPAVQRGTLGLAAARRAGSSASQPTNHGLGDVGTWGWRPWTNRVRVGGATSRYRFPAKRIPASTLRSLPFASSPRPPPALPSL